MLDKPNAIQHSRIDDLTEGDQKGNYCDQVYIAFHHGNFEGAELYCIKHWVKVTEQGATKYYFPEDAIRIRISRCRCRGRYIHKNRIINTISIRRSIIIRILKKEASPELSATLNRRNKHLQKLMQIQKHHHLYQQKHQHRQK